MLRLCRVRLARWICVLTWLAALPGLAQTPSSERGGAKPAADPNVDEARQLFAEGLAFVEHEDWANAEQRFRRVLALRSSQVVAYNLASALMHLGRMVEGAELLRGIVRDPTAEATSRDAATQLLSEMEPRIGTLTIRVTGDAHDASLRMDDKPVELTGSVQTISVDPGSHRVVALRGETELASKPAEVGGDAPLQVEVLLELPAAVGPRAAARAAGSSSSGNRAVLGNDDSKHSSARDDGGSSSVFASPWFWTGAGGVVVAGVITAVLLAPAAKASPVSGDTSPPVIHGTVKAP